MGLFDFLTSSDTRTAPRTSLDVKSAPSMASKVIEYVEDRMLTNNELVQKIHKEFYTASDRLLAEAKFILEKAPKAYIERGERLAKLGFTSTENAVKAEEHKKVVMMQQGIADTINEYAVKYPLDKFITEDEIKVICEKYNLVMGSIRLYKGDVPDKNLQEIENARPLLPEDESWAVVHDYGFGENVSFKSRIQAEEEQELMAGHSRFGYVSYVKASYHICAPIKDMDTTNMELKGHVLTKIHIPDPIVLERTTSSLWRIITAWGEEAGDEIVVNPVLN